MKHIAVIGGGAAGLCAAISAAFQARACNIPVPIHVFEAHAKLGHSILATGNGRCNISHEAFLSSDEQQALHACTGAAPWDLGSCMPSMGANNICAQEISNNASPACVARALCDMRLPIESVKADQCLVMRGGIAINEVDAQTLRVSNSSALYAVGEALDVDASCGGFNLHWAWSSGILAGACAVNTWRDAS